LPAFDLSIATPDGTAAARAFRPEGPGPFPAALFLIDAFGLRTAIFEMAERLSRLGYFVLVPNLLYRAGDFAPFDPKSAFGDEAERARLMGIMKQLDPAGAMRDMAAYFDALAAQPGVLASKVGCVGYCMGGRLAFTAAAAMPDRVGAVCSIHGGGLVTDQESSPHLGASRIRAPLYFGVADDDQGCTPQHQATLVSTLAAAKVHYQVELNPGAHHGYAVLDVPAYHPEAAERHWARVASLFGEALPRG